MSMHKKPLLPHEEAALVSHGLPVGLPSQLADAFRMGMEAERERLQAMLREAVAVRDGPEWPLPGSRENMAKRKALWARIEAELKPNTTDDRPQVRSI